MDALKVIRSGELQELQRSAHSLRKANKEIADLRDKLMQAEEERDGLKGALEEIADYPNQPKCCIYVDYSCRLLEIARKALEGSDG